MYISLSSIPKENEVSVKSFLTLKEIDSLSKMRITQLNVKSDQEKRIQKLNEKRQGIENEMISLKKEIVQHQGLLGTVEDKIKTAVQQKQRLIDLGGDEKKILAYDLEIKSLEDKGFEYLTIIDEFETTIVDHKTFLIGLTKTLEEIDQEVREELTKIEADIKNIDLRLDLLREELPPEFKTTLAKISAKNLALGPFTRIDQGSCFFCRFKISRIEESEIDMQKNLKTCPQCTRIFLPYGA
jgi:predicted  nucleic acid-binding Zn-ribbon protein